MARENTTPIMINTPVGRIPLWSQRLGMRHAAALYESMRQAFPKQELRDPHAMCCCMLRPHCHWHAWVTDAPLPEPAPVSLPTPTAKASSGPAGEQAIIDGGDPSIRTWPRLRSGDTLVLLFSAWKIQQGWFWEYLAVHPSLRGAGVGGSFIDRELRRVSGQHELCVLEVEPALTPLRQRRIATYERHGFLRSPFVYRQPSLQQGCAPVALHLMTYPFAVDEPTHRALAISLARDVYEAQGFDPCRGDEG